jgi:hypothetical protein
VHSLCGTTRSSTLLLLLLLQINGKKLHPARGVFARFMTPLLLWWMLAFIIYGLSLNDLNKLQQPLTSLQVNAGSRSILL